MDHTDWLLTWNQQTSPVQPTLYSSFKVSMVSLFLALCNYKDVGKHSSTLKHLYLRNQRHLPPYAISIHSDNSWRTVRPLGH